MAFDIAIKQAQDALAQAKPYVVGAKAGCDFSDGLFHIRFFNRSLLVHHPQVAIEEEHSPAAPPQWLQLILMHYLLAADGSGIEDKWITYRYLPGATFFEERFTHMAVQGLLKKFGNNLEGFKRAGAGIGGVPMSRSGDAAFRFMALPRVPMACILYLGDDEVSPQVNVLFDASAPHYLPTEDLSYCGWYMSYALQSKVLSDNEFIAHSHGLEEGH